MPTFRYTTMGNNGSGSPVIDAPDRAAAIRELVRRGVTPTKIEVVSDNSSSASTMPSWASRSAEPSTNGRLNGSTTLVPKSPSAPPRATAAASTRLASSTSQDSAVTNSSSSFFARPAMSRAEVASFIRELSTAVQAGLPLIQGLRTIARQGRGINQKAMLNAVIEGVEQGKSLGDSMALQGRSFNELTVNLVRAGEASGKLGEVLQQAADLLDREIKLRRGILAATLYPMILAGLIAISVVIVVTVIVPNILKPLAGKIVKMPLPTQIVQAVASFVSSYWWAIIPVIAATLYIIITLYRTPGPRLWFDGFILRVPVLGRLMRDVAVGRFTRTLGTLVAAGIPAVAALRITKGTLGNRQMERVIDDVCDQVTSGKTIADPMEQSGLFPPMLVQIINLGERSGRLDQMLNQAANAFEDKTETSLKLFTTALPPILVVMLACVVGFIVLSILLPLLSAQEALG